MRDLCAFDGDNRWMPPVCIRSHTKAAKKLLDRMGLTMEDVKEAQKKRLRRRASGKKAAAAPVKEKKKQQPKVVIRNTNTAMGKALAGGYGGMTLEGEDAGRTVRQCTARQPKAAISRI